MVSVIILNYNTYEVTSACIRSVIEHTSCNYEIILVDNASTECDPVNFKKEFPEINLQLSNQNLGFSKGNNLGIKASKGTHLLLLNSDTIFQNDAIGMCLDKLIKNNSIGAISCQLISEDGTLQQTSNSLYPIWRLFLNSLKLHFIFPSITLRPPNLDEEHFTESIWGTFFLFPRNILSIFPDKKLPETFFMYYEDVEWSYYIRRAGKKILYYPDAKIIHLGGKSGDEKNSASTHQNLDSLYKLIKIMRGKIYATTYFFTLALFHMTNFKKTRLRHSFNFVIIGFTGLFFRK